MSFKAAEWDNNDIGDKIHLELFRKKKTAPKNKNKPKQKRPTRGLTNTESSNKNVTQKLPNFKTLLVDKIKKNLADAIHSNDKPAETTQTQLKTKQTKAKLKPKLKTPQVSTKRVNVNVKPAPKIKKKIKRLSTEKVNAKVNKPTGLNIANLKKQLAASLDAGAEGGSGKEGPSTLREKMLDKLNAARFRFLNEQMYTSAGAEAQKLFQADPEAFRTYHQGYRRQVQRWPVNPLERVIEALRALPAGLVVADLGCGDARLASSLPQHTVHSFDLVAAAPGVTACDMARVPLKNGSVDVAVYCLSLMGTNLRDYLLEANRLLRIGGVLKIAEVESRFQGVDPFVQALHKFGFKETHRDLSHDLFYFLDFVKERHVKHKSKLPALSLRPCLYKKR